LPTAFCVASRYLHEGHSKVFAETATKMGQRVVVKMLIAGDEPKRQRIAGDLLNLAAGKGARG